MRAQEMLSVLFLICQNATTTLEICLQVTLAWDFLLNYFLDSLLRADETDVEVLSTLLTKRAQG